MPNGSARPTEFNQRVVLISTKAEFHEMLENYRRWRQQFLDETGELEAALSAGAAGGLVHAGTRRGQRQQIPVPKGPVEVW